MAPVLIIGASKGIGFETTLQALEAGHQVRALARSAAGIGLSDPKLGRCGFAARAGVRSVCHYLRMLAMPCSTI